MIDLKDRMIVRSNDNLLYVVFDDHLWLSPDLEYDTWFVYHDPQDIRILEAYEIVDRTDDFNTSLFLTERLEWSDLTDEDKKCMKLVWKIGDK